MQHVSFYCRSESFAENVRCQISIVTGVGVVRMTRAGRRAAKVCKLETHGEGLCVRGFVVDENVRGPRADLNTRYLSA